MKKDESPGVLPTVRIVIVGIIFPCNLNISSGFYVLQALAEGGDRKPA